MAGMNVSVTIKLVDQLTGGLKAAAAEMKRFGDAAKDVQRAFAGSQAAGALNSLRAQVRGLQGELRQLGAEMQKVGSGAGGSMFGRQAVSNMQQMLRMQQQMVANAQRLNQVAARPAPPAVATGWLGRNGFSPNASLADRAQYRGVNLAERSLADGALSIDKARTRFDILGIPEAERRQIEEGVKALGQRFRMFTHADILDTYGELVTQFKSSAEAMRLLPEMLDVQRLGILTGDTREKSRQGMLSLLRGAGLSGRLTDAGGNLTLDETKGFLDAYKRARVIGGTDVNPDQAFQLVKYLKQTGQTLTTDALLEAMIAMPDLRASSYGNQLNQLRAQLTGTATKDALANQAKAGWIHGAIDPNSPAGPKKFRYGGTVDSELLRENPSAWVQKHVVGYLKREGVDPMTASPAQIADKLSPMFSNQSAGNIVNMIVNQMQEWKNQRENAAKLNFSEENMERIQKGSLWSSLQEAQAQLSNVLGAAAENFKGILIPALDGASAALRQITHAIDPQTGNPLARTGLIAGGGLAGFLALRTLMSNPLGRLLVGGGLGMMTGGLSGAAIGAGSAAAMGPLARLFGAGAAAGGGVVGRSMLMRLLFGAAGLTGGTLLPMLLASLGVGFAVNGIGTTIAGWDMQKGFWENIQAGFAQTFHEHIMGLRQALGHDDANAATNIEDWRAKVLGQIKADRAQREMSNDPALANIAQGAGLPAKIVDSNISKAADSVSGAITNGGGSIASALAAAANAIRAAAGAIGAAAGSIGPAGTGVVGNASRGSMGDGK